MANKSNRNKTKFTVLQLLLAASSMVVSQVGAVNSLSTQRLQSEIEKQNLQVQVYDALESLHNDEWAGKTMTTQELLQLDSDQKLNDLLVDHLAKHSKKQVTNGQKIQNAKRLDCIIGGTNCLYKDKTSLINGQLSEYVQTGYE